MRSIDRAGEFGKEIDKLGCSCSISRRLWNKLQNKQYSREIGPHDSCKDMVVILWVCYMLPQNVEKGE